MAKNSFVAEVTLRYFKSEITRVSHLGMSKDLVCPLAKSNTTRTRNQRRAKGQRLLIDQIRTKKVV